MKRILLTGANGQVGWELKRSLATLGTVIPYDKSTLDLVNHKEIQSVISIAKPHYIVNAAAYTAVDKAENNEDTANAINAHAPEILAREAVRCGALLIHYSTDYVFDGNAHAPYKEDAIANPLNVYGKTKHRGELAITAQDGRYIIFRTSWVYGLRGTNFLLTMLRLGKEKKQLKIVNDQIGAPTWCRLIAHATAQIITADIHKPFERDVSGIYHLTSMGQTSWYSFAEAIFQEAYVDLASIPTLLPIPSSDYPTPALRPKNSVLCNAKTAKTFNIQMPHWHDALKMCIQDGQDKNRWTG